MANISLEEQRERAREAVHGIIHPDQKYQKRLTPQQRDIGQKVATSSGNEEFSVINKFSEKHTLHEDIVHHPYSEFFPEPTLSEYNELLENIELHGQLVPVVVTRDGKLVDGRTRCKILKQLGCPIIAHTWQGEDDELLGFLINRMQQRQLNKQELAVVALDFMDEEKNLAKQRQGNRKDIFFYNLDKPEDEGRALDILAKKFGTNRRYIQQANAIRSDIELFDRLKHRELTLKIAYRILVRLSETEDRRKVAEKYIELEKTTKIKEKNTEAIDAIIDEISGGKILAEKTNKPPINKFKFIAIPQKLEDSVGREIEELLLKNGFKEKPFSKSDINKIFSKEAAPVTAYSLPLKTD